MATTNPFDLLGDDDQGDLSQLIAAQQLKLAAEPKKAAAPVKSGAAKSDAPGKLPSKPLPPAQAVREARDGPRGRGRGGGGGGRGYGRGRGGGGSNGDYGNNENSYSSNGFSGGYNKPTEDGDAGKAAERRPYGAPRGGYRGGRRGGFSNGGDEEGERPRRVFERHSGTGRSNDFKREGSGRGNWGTPEDEITPVAGDASVETEKVVSAENEQPGQDAAGDASKDVPVKEPEEKEPEDNEMTLEEYQKVLEEKRKALISEKTTEGRKVEDKDFESMQLLSSKKTDEEIFAKLGSDKEKRKETAGKEEKVKKSLNINEFLKPAERERSGGRGRGRGGRGPRGGFNGGSYTAPVRAPAIDDDGQFPSLRAK